MIPFVFKILKKFIKIEWEIPRPRSGLFVDSLHYAKPKVTRQFYCLEKEHEHFHWYQHILCQEERLYWYEYLLTAPFHKCYWENYAIPRLRFEYAMATASFLLAIFRPKMLLVLPFFIGAIAFDSTNNGGVQSATSQTWSMTNSAGTYMLAPSGTLGATRTISSITYGGDALAQIATTVKDDATFTLHTEFWNKATPKTGANNVVFTPTASTKFVSGIITYTGVGGVGAAGGSMHGNQAGSSFTDSITTTAANSIVASVIMFGQHSGTVADTFTSGNTRYALAANQGSAAGDISTPTVTTYNLGWQTTATPGGYNSVTDLIQSLVELTPSGGAPVNSSFFQLM